MYLLMLTAFVAIQLVIVLLDLWDMRPSASDDPQPSWRTRVFLLAVTGAFLSIQLAGGWLTPQPLELMDMVRQHVSTWAGPSTTQTISTRAAVLLSVALFYTAGLWDYLVHRYFSHSRWFWITHEYHHLPRRVSVLMPGIFVRPFGFIPVTLSTLATAATVYASLFALGLPLWDVSPLVPTLLLIGLVLTASHSSCLRRRPWVHHALRCGLLTSPQEHLLHHAIESQGNFGNFTTLWDRVFGTYIDPLGIDLEHVRLGLAYDQDFLGTLTLGRLRLSRSQRRKYQVGRYCNLETPEGQ